MQRRDLQRASRAYGIANIGRMSQVPSLNRLRDGQRRADGGGPRGEGQYLGGEPVDRRIARLAEGQYGLVTRRQLETLGLGRGSIESRLQRGQLHPIHRSVYAVGHRLLSERGRWMAAVMACGEGAVLSHRAAGRLWGIVPSGDGLPEVTRSKGWKQRPGIVQHHSPLPPDEVDRFAGIPVTGLSRTLLDLASVLSLSQLERALNEAEVLGLTDRTSIRTLLERYPRRRGTAVLRRLLRDEDALRGITRRELEARFATILAATDLPRPQRNVDLAIGGRFFEVDCLWREQRLAVELDGRATHGTARAFEGDREKDRLLLVEGWNMVRITWRQLRDEPGAIVTDLSRLLAARVVA